MFVRWGLIIDNIETISNNICSKAGQMDNVSLLPTISTFLFIKKVWYRRKLKRGGKGSNLIEIWNVCYYIIKDY